MILTRSHVYGVALPKIANGCLRAVLRVRSAKETDAPLSHSVLAQIYLATRRLTTFQFARAEEFETVTGEEYKNIKSHMPSEHFPRYI